MEVVPEVKVGVKDGNTNGGEIEHVDNGKLRKDEAEPEASVGTDKMVTKELRNRN